ncbi:MAG TPA: hypothetical protein VFC37_05550 [Terracidiphilus sp.]|nr:hypothetical protein [Terracidiphilus sp.]
MDQATKERLLTEFDGRLAAYRSLSRYSQGILADFLHIARLQVLSVSDRVKDRDSLSEKLSRPGKHYASLQEVTDVVGLRVVTFFEDEVNEVARIVAGEFELIPEHCVDRRDYAEPDRFGYRSLHYVCRLPQARRDLTETGTYRDELFEVQIRSILQHAWAEIEHLGYKSPIAMPHEIKHRMSRVAGLLEIADLEFMKVRDDSLAYRNQVASEIEQNDLAGIELNAISYLEFIANSQLVRELDGFIGDDLHIDIDITADPDEDFLVECLRSVDVVLIQALQERLQENIALLKAFAKLFMVGHTQGSTAPIAPAISIFHLAQILALKQGGTKRLADFYDQHKITGVGDSMRSAQDTADTVTQAQETLD